MTLPAGAQDVEDLTRKDISFGLPQETESLTTVEVYDSDNNGRDEIYLGASYFTNNDEDVLSEGIFAYEYNPSSTRWETFGSGLPGEGSGVAFAAIGLGDINEDGKIDIAAPVPTRWYLDLEPTVAGVYLYTGDGFGNYDYLNKISLTNPLGTNYHDSSNEAEIVDLDGDGHADIVVTTYIGIRVFYGDSTGTNWEEQNPPHPTQTEISGVGIGDLNNDGMLDMIGTPYQRSSEVELYIQESARVFRQRDFQETSAGFGVKIADLNDDGNNDVVFGTAGDGIEVWLGEGSVTLTSFPCTEASDGLPFNDGNWNQVELGDVNGDGKLDIISACNTYTTVNVYINDLPNGWIEVFTDSNSLEVGGEPYGANFGDWDGDGLLDVAGCSWNHGANAWLVSLEGYGIPVAHAGGDETISLGESIRLDGTDSEDRDGSIVEWVWECLSHPSVTLMNDDTSRPTFNPEEEGYFDFQLTIKDNDDQWSNPATVSITVLDPGVNYPPIAVPYHETGFGLVGNKIEMDGSGSSDQDGEVVGYEWTWKSDHDLVISNANQENAYFTPIEDGEYVLSLVVTDDGGVKSPPATILIHVEEEEEEEAVVINLGPFLYDNGNPISGAAVWLEMGGQLHSEETDSQGYAKFTDGVPPGSYKCWVTKDGLTIIDEFSVSITYDGTLTVEGGEYPTATGEETIIWIIALVIILVVVLVIVIVVVMVKVTNRNQPEMVEAVIAQPRAGCPNCGGQLTYMQDFGKYYCSNCNAYH